MLATMRSLVGIGRPQDEDQARAHDTIGVGAPGHLGHGDAALVRKGEAATRHSQK
jgi:hypothetical protein